MSTHNRCTKCGKAFPDSSKLRRHAMRKTPCAPILAKEDLPAAEREKGYNCRFCGRAFTSPPALSRHTRQRCKIANSDEGMEKLLDHTLTKQVQHLETQVAELTALLKQQLAVTSAPAAPAQNITIEGARTAVQNIGVQNNVTNNHITIRPWGGPDRIYVTTAMLRAAFAENPRLVEYCRLDGPDQVDAKTAVPYVLEALVDLVKRAHADPEARNVYLNPRRGDQVLVYDEMWKVLTLVEAIRALFDGAAQGIKRIILSNADREQLTQEVQSAAAGIPYLYEDEAEEYVKRAHKPLSAHLANTAPATLAAS